MFSLKEELKEFLDRKTDYYNNPSFIQNDPILIPHQFSLKQDVEIMGFFAATLAWGQRKTIISKCFELAERMGGEPHTFVTQHAESDLKLLLGFKHRTFNDTDLLYFVDFLRWHYDRYVKQLLTLLICGQVCKITCMREIYR